MLDREVFYALLQVRVRVLSEQYRRTYNQIKPHRPLVYRLPAPETILPTNLGPVLVGLT